MEEEQRKGTSSPAQQITRSKGIEIPNGLRFATLSLVLQGLASMPMQDHNAYHLLAMLSYGGTEQEYILSITDAHKQYKNKLYPLYLLSDHKFLHTLSWRTIIVQPAGTLSITSSTITSLHQPITIWRFSSTKSNKNLSTTETSHKSRTTYLFEFSDTQFKYSLLFPSFDRDCCIPQINASSQAIVSPGQNVELTIKNFRAGLTLQLYPSPKCIALEFPVISFKLPETNVPGSVLDIFLLRPGLPPDKVSFNMIGPPIAQIPGKYPFEPITVVDSLYDKSINVPFPHARYEPTPLRKYFPNIGKRKFKTKKSKVRKSSRSVGDPLSDPEENENPKTSEYSLETLEAKKYKLPENGMVGTAKLGVLMRPKRRGKWEPTNFSLHKIGKTRKILVEFLGLQCPLFVEVVSSNSHSLKLSDNDKPPVLNDDVVSGYVTPKENKFCVYLIPSAPGSVLLTITASPITVECFSLDELPISIPVYSWNINIETSQYESSPKGIRLSGTNVKSEFVELKFTRTQKSDDKKMEGLGTKNSECPVALDSDTDTDTESECD